MFNIKRILQCVALLLICCLCASCTNGIELCSTNKLVLYCPEILSNSVRTAVSVFQNQYPDVEIENRLCNGDEYEQILRTEVMAGKGPDLIFFWGDEFQDTEKAMDAGVFFRYRYTSRKGYLL